MFELSDEWTLKELLHFYVLYQLRICRGNRLVTANKLGVSLRWLRTKINDMEVLGIEVPKPLDNLRAYESQKEAYKKRFRSNKQVATWKGIKVRP